MSTIAAEVHHQMDIVTPIKPMVQHINSNGDWMIAGWHCRGIIDNDTNDPIVQTNSKGHITFLFPTKPGTLKKDEFIKMSIATPDDFGSPLTPDSDPPTTSPNEHKTINSDGSDSPTSNAKKRKEAPIPLLLPRPTVPEIRKHPISKLCFLIAPNHTD